MSSECLLNLPTLKLPKGSVWDKVFKNGPSKICERQPLKNLKRHIPSNILKAVFH